MHKVDKDAVWKELGERYDVSFVTTFLNNGANVYLFGGAPRDIVMGRTWKDADFCVVIDLPPAEKDSKAEEIFTLSNISIQSKTDLGHGKTVYRFKDTQSNELVDVRVVQDMWAGGTDFTVNSLRLDLASGELVDRYGAQKDIQARILRTAVPAEELFEENPFMIFRSVKAACQLDFKLADEVTKAMKSFVHKTDVCIDLVHQNESDFAEWVLSNMFAGLKYSPYKYFSLLEEAGVVRFFAETFAKRLGINGVPREIPNPFQPDSKHDYEEAISIYLSTIARIIQSKDSEEVFAKLADYLHILSPKRGDDFAISAADIKYQN